MSDTIDYGNLMHSAMRELIRTVLNDVKAGGLPGDHHFFITFDTTHEGVEIAGWLKDRFPENMTIVVQHWYDNLEVDEEFFGITLNFSDNPEHLVIPFDSILTFVDPSVEFGLRFETQEPSDKEKAPKAPAAAKPQPDKPKTEEKSSGDAEVVSLDAFRKH